MLKSFILDMDRHSTRIPDAAVISLTNKSGASFPITSHHSIMILRLEQCNRKSNSY